MTGLINIYIGYSCLLLAAILALYQTKKYWIWLLAYRNDKQPNKDNQLQKLYNKLDSIGKSKILDNQSVMDEKDRLNEWKDDARRLIAKLYDQNEIAIFLNKIDFVEKKDEYNNHAIGGIQAFYNEKNLYLTYLKNLLGDHHGQGKAARARR
jgi:hypothetical protein